MRVCVRSFGCSTNLADGEAMAGCLAEVGYEIVSNASDADLLIFNTCGVKGPTENRVVSALKRVPAGKKVIAAGCLPLIDFQRLSKEVCLDGVVGPAPAYSIVDVVQRVLEGQKVIALEGTLDAKPDLTSPRTRRNALISIVPVSYGCQGTCAYCCVVFARGRLRSCGIEEVVERVKIDAADGVQEFWLTSQDTGSYGRDIGTNLAQLLNAICCVKGNFMFRVGMMTPNTIKDSINELVQAFKDKHIFRFVHVPVQSGNDQVLRRMNRKYLVKEFKEIVQVFRASLPDTTISTDVICGFPGETEEAFGETMALIREVKPDVLNVSKFYARPRTAAEKMTADAVPLAEIRRRSAAAMRLGLSLSYERNRRWIRWKGEVLIDEIGKLPDSWVGRNFAYKPVVVRRKAVLLGRTLQVRITKAFPTFLEGEEVE
jgi:threonylcarbamoyladenosine tRNA methylthiotransferase CDKAL1